MYNKEKEQREKEFEQTVETLKQTVQTLEHDLEGLKGQHKLMLNFQEHKLEKKQLEESSKKKTGRKT